MMLPIIASRAYNSFEINAGSQTITKLSANNRLLDEVAFYKRLPKKFQLFFPKMLDYGYRDSESKHFMELELYGYDNLGRYLVGQKELTKDQWKKVASHLHKILKRFQTEEADNVYSDLFAMYEQKTEVEQKNLIDNFETFKKINAYESISINWKEYRNFDETWRLLKKDLKRLLYEDCLPGFVHGDLCFSNILVGLTPTNDVVLKFIDPRGKFGTAVNTGDGYYDLAKLMHSTDVGYEYSIFDRVGYEYNKELNDFHFETNDNKTMVHEIFKKEIYDNYNFTKIKLLEAMIFVGMAARHYDSEARQIFMYLSGLRLLNEVVEELKCM